MSISLRDFIAQREAEIREQQKALKVEMRELQIAKNALDAQGDTGQSPAPPAGPTIKDLAKEVLGDAPDGYTSVEILDAIKNKHGREIDRTSLSPQLSRLKDSGEVVLQGQKWFLTALHAAWEERILEGVMLELEPDEEPDEEYAVVIDDDL